MDFWELFQLPKHMDNLMKHAKTWIIFFYNIDKEQNKKQA